MTAGTVGFSVTDGHRPPLQQRWIALSERDHRHRTSRFTFPPAEVYSMSKPVPT
jgi:hypothetical protein